MNKLERPERLEELNPEATLKKIQLKDGMIFADIGAGTGIFTFEAAKMTKGKIFAVDISEDKRKILNEKKILLKNYNVEIIPSITQIPNESCDVVFICTVLHEIEDVKNFLMELRTKMKKVAKLVIIEFHKKQTTMGPPIEIRLDENELIKKLNSYGFVLDDKFYLGENFYCVVFK